MSESLTVLRGLGSTLLIGCPSLWVKVTRLLFCALLAGSTLLFGLIGKAYAQDLDDPIEPFNRGMFWFNDKLDVYLLEPAARGYDYVAPAPVKKGISNFFVNLRSPIYLVSDLVQLKFGQAWRHTARFVINTTVGVVGFIDVAQYMDLPHHEEDFGTALGYHGLPPGPYIMLPLLGPTDLRDGFGRIVDAFLTPTYYIDDPWIIAGAKAVETVDDRRKLLDAVEVGKQSSFDYYLFVRSSYAQRRLNLIYDGNPPAELLPPPEELQDPLDNPGNKTDK